jgi:hypothetical protein
MQYMAFIATDPEADPYDPELDDIDAWVDEADRSGIRVTGCRLRPVEDATTIRVRGGEVLITDGPFTESREWVAGFDILEAADLDTAIALMAKHPMARFGRIEVRPFWPFTD